jgi:AraC-like DNA-binding protein
MSVACCESVVEAGYWPASTECPACAATPAQATVQTTALAGCLDLRLVFAGSLCRLARTRCVHDGRELSAERSHAVPVLSVSFVGASLIHSGRRRLQADPANALWSRAGEGYRAEHPWGPSCRSCHLAFDPELGAELDRLAPSREAGPRLVAPPLRALLRLRLLVCALGDAGGFGECVGGGGGCHEGGERGSGVGIGCVGSGCVDGVCAVSPLEVEERLIAVAHDTLAGGMVAGGAGERAAATVRETDRRHRRVVTRATELLQERFRERLPLAEVARAACSSPAHLTRLFRRYTGVTLHAYQTRLRLVAALDSVLEPGVDLSALAFELGFSSHSHLTASFRRELGSTPAELRREVRRSSVVRARVPELAAGLSRSVPARRDSVRAGVAAGR